jgi:uncharacterized protein (TIGR03643 family)
MLFLFMPIQLNANLLSAVDIDRVIEMAWEDRTPFEAITFQFGLTEQQVIQLMRSQMRLSSFKMWRARVQGRATKHALLRNSDVKQFKCTQQRQITLNKISKRR